MRRLVGVHLLVAALMLVGCVPASIGTSAVSVLQARDQLVGRILYVHDGDLWVWQNGEVRQLTSGATWKQAAYSPDGSEIAYVYDGPNFNDVWVMTQDGKSNRRLTTGQSRFVEDNVWSMRPAWSPDGRLLAFVSDANSAYPTLWTVNKDGSGRRPVPQIGATLEAVDAVSWSPDGGRVMLTGVPPGFGKDPSQIYSVEIPRGQIERFTSHPDGAFDPSWSPDGKTVAYVGREGGRTDVWLRRVDHAGEARFDKLAHVRAPTWSPDGRHLAVISAQTGAFDVWVISVSIQGETMRFGDYRQLTRDGAVDPVSGLSWGR
jgi:TolB protein